MEGLMVNTEDRGIDPKHAALPLEEADIQRAKIVATRAHERQVDAAGRPYIDHPRRVVGHLVNPTAEEAVVAWLHDVVEDTDVTLQEVEKEFGSKVAVAVNAITCRTEEPRDDYYARVKANPIALTVKAADLADNTDPARLALLKPERRAHFEDKYAHARRVLGIY